MCSSLITGTHILSIYVPVNNSMLIHNVAGPEGNVHVDMIFHLSGLEFGNILILLSVYNTLLKRQKDIHILAQFWNSSPFGHICDQTPSYEYSTSHSSKLGNLISGIQRQLLLMCLQLLLRLVLVYCLIICKSF